MKRISFLLVAALLSGAIVARADDAAVEERLNKLSGQMEDLLGAVARQDKRLSALEKELESVREQAAKPGGNYASQEELRKLWEKLQEIDQKRLADNERIVKEIDKLGKAPTGGSKPKPAKPLNPVEDSGKGAGNPGGGADKGFEYVIAPGDTPSTIAQAYREKGVKVTSEQILKANPGVKERSLKVGQKIFIPGTPPP
jgi:LysM repeat protein